MSDNTVEYYKRKLGVSSLEDARDKLGMTMAQFSRHIGVTLTTIRNRERGGENTLYMSAILLLLLRKDEDERRDRILEMVAETRDIAASKIAMCANMNRIDLVSESISGEIVQALRLLATCQSLERSVRRGLTE